MNVHVPWAANVSSDSLNADQLGFQRKGGGRLAVGL
jgi:hypothetical protein